jgi:hypothetical protein
MSRTNILVASWFFCGCVMSDDSVALVEQEVNVIMPNGATLTGVGPSVIMPNGTSLTGILPGGVMPDGTLVGVSGTGALAGADIVGSSWTGNISDGSVVVLRIEEAERQQGDNEDLWSYRFSVSARGTTLPLCVDAAGHGVFADTVGGTWNFGEGVPGGGAYQADATQFTIACRGSTIAKCLEVGYKPWDGAVRELESCVRALRADYCGDGTPFTVDGTLIRLFDDAGIQPDDPSWVPEAEWSPDGALCVSNKKNTRFYQVADETPPCFPHTLKPKNSCGTEFAEGATIITELAPR